MKITYFATGAYKRRITDTTSEINCIGFDADEDEINEYRENDNLTPMISFKTDDGRNVFVPVQLVIGIKED